MSLQQFLARVKVPDEYLEFGKEITLTHTEVVPVSAEVYWSGFDDYFHLQHFVGMHENMTTIKGDGGVGTVIEFDFLGGRTQEELVQKDDAAKIWAIAMLGSNPIFTSYLATVKVDEDTSETAKVTMSIKGIFALKDYNMRRGQIAFTRYMLRNRINEIMAVIADAKGNVLHFDFDVDCSFTKLWETVSDWESISWVMNSTGVEVVPDYQANDLRRKIFFGPHFTEERLVQTIDKPASLTYEFGRNDRMGVLHYRGKLELVKINERKTNVKYTTYITPQPGADPKTTIKALMEPRFKWIQATFAEKPKSLPGHAQKKSVKTSAIVTKLIDDCILSKGFLAEGAEVFLEHTEVVPVSADEYWSGFQDFVQLQLYLEGHERVKVLKGYGEVGTVVSFYYDPTDLAEGQREMKLVEKDDSTRTWRVQEASPNELYKSYEMAIKVSGTTTASVTISARFVSAIKNADDRRNDIAYHKVHLLGATVRDVLNFVVAEKIGRKHRIDEEVDISRDKLWGIMGNFNDVTWIPNASFAQVSGDSKNITFSNDPNCFGGHGNVDARLVWYDSSDWLMVLEYTGRMPTKFYREKIQLFSTGPNKTRVTYEYTALPDKDETGETFDKWFIPTITNRVAYLKKMFEDEFDDGDHDVSPSGPPSGPPVFPKGAYSTLAQGRVNAPVKEVWKVFRPFGKDCLEYWKIYESMKIEPPGKDVVGCVRSFVTSKTGSHIKERLEWRDDINHVEIYSMLSMTPPPPVTMSNVYTTITMTEVGEKETEVKFECTFDVSVSFAVSRIQDNQKGAYMACINGLQQLFHSEVGTLEVVVGSAADLARTDGWFDADPYVVVAVNDGKPVTTKVCSATQKPIWDERFQLPVTSRTRNVIFTVLDRDTVGQDDIMGTANVNLDELTSGKEKKMALDVQGGGTLNVRLYLKMHDKPKEPEGEKLVTSLAIPFLAPVAQSELDAIRNEFTNLITSFLGPGQKYEYVYMQRLRTHPDVPLEEYPAACVPMPTQEMFTPHKAGRLMQRLMEFIGSQAQIMVRLAQVKGLWDPWKANFSGYLPANERLIEEWQKDEEFCRQYLQGINPMVVALCKDQSRIPAEMLGLKGQGKTTLQLMEENRLFIVDYAPMLGVPATPGKFFYAPIVLMYKEELAGGKSRLNMLGIQLTRDKGKNEVYSPESAKTQPNKYMFAKMHVVSADNNVHQFLYHLGYTHLGMEPLVVAMHTHLPPDHPIHRLLLPHFRDTIGINYLARHSLVSRIFPITDPMFATSTVGGLVMFLNEWRKYNFMDMA
ncbi:ALOX5 [Branchiostoma lanceolatum]|nr:ALOX5 [Branchiostoma lanceolatum]